MEKYDRQITIFRHRSSRTLLLFPYVCYMAGVSSAYGDAVLLFEDDISSELLGQTVCDLLATCRQANIDELANARKQALQKRWKHEQVSESELLPVSSTASNWTRITNRFPALTKGPGTYLRSFSVIEVVERNSWKSRTIIQLKKDKYRSCLSAGTERRIPLAVSNDELGRQIEHFLDECERP
jgi:hypothetical protein